MIVPTLKNGDTKEVDRTTSVRIVSTAFRIIEEKMIEDYSKSFGENMLKEDKRFET